MPAYAQPPPRVPYDPLMGGFSELSPWGSKLPTQGMQDFVNARRKEYNQHMGYLGQVVRADKELKVEERKIPGPVGDIGLVIIRRAGPAPSFPRPGLVYIHGGAMYTGDPFLGLDTDSWVKDMDSVLISVDYRLAPEQKDAALAEECYAAMKWIGDHLQELGIHKERLLLGGASAGSGIAAGTALLMRDKGGPKLCGLMLQCPMLDDKNNSVSCRQFATSGTFTGTQNQYAWSTVLGDKAGGDNVSIYAAPARAEDLSGLPETFIDVGSAEPFRDEAVAFASKLWAAGTQAELHVWPGGLHGFSLWIPNAEISKLSLEMRNAWMKRKLLRDVEKDYLFRVD